MPGLRLCFVDFVEVIGLGLDNASRSAAPNYFDAEVIRSVPGGKHPERVVAGKIATTANHFLALRHRPAGERDFCADSARVRRPAFESYGDTWSRRVIAQNRRRAVQVIDDNVEITVVIQIRKCHSL